jgi:hypothetical protein
LDSALCPDVVTDLIEEDWNHTVHEDFRIKLFREPDYLLGRQPFDASRHQLLGVVEDPKGNEVIPLGFTHCGFDLMDACFGNSALTNCGRQPEAFAPSIVNEFGLVADLKTAIKIRDKLRRLQPDDPHLGDCNVWLIARASPAR